jgi:putative peptidoglycan lipid II flippase
LRTSFKSLSKLSGLTLVSRLLGFLRDILFASWFIHQPAFESFLIAFQIPNFLRRIFSEGTTNQALVPSLSKLTSEEAKTLIAYCISYLLIGVSVIVLIAQIYPQIFLYTFAHGLLPEDPRYPIALTYIRITIFFLFTATISNLLSAWLQTYNHPTPTAMTPIFLNLSLILAALFFRSCLALSYALIFSGILQVWYLNHHSKRCSSFSLTFKFKNMSDEVKNNLTIMLHLAAPALILQCTPIIDTYFASYLHPGSIAILYYAQRLVMLPLGMISVSIVSVILPQKTRAFREQKHDLFTQQMAWSINTTLFFALPAALGLYFLRGPVIATLFMHGNFTYFYLIKTMNCLAYLAIALPAFMLNKVLYNAFYAQLNRRIPTFVISINLIIIVIANLLLIPHFGLYGIAISSAIGAWLSTTILWSTLTFQGFYLWKDNQTSLLRFFAATGLIAYALELSTDHVDWLIFCQTHSTILQIMMLFSWIIFTVLLYTVSLHLMGWRARFISSIPECFHPDTVSG